MIKKIVLVTLLIALPLVAVKAKTIKLLSPNEKNRVVITLNDKISYSVFHNNDTLLYNCVLGMTLGDGTELGTNPKLQKQKKNTVTQTIVSPFYKFSSFTSNYNEVDLKLRGNYGIIFRAYDDGIAYRFYTTFDNELTIANETAEFQLTKDCPVYLSHSTSREKPFAMSFQTNFTVSKLSEAHSQVAFLPATFDYGNQLKLTLLESDVESYPCMFVQAQGKELKLKAVFAPYPAKMEYYRWRKMSYVAQGEPFISKGNGTRSYPWRAFAITEKDTEMPVNNMVYALASPNRIGNTMWIKPGKVAWDWWNDWGLKGVDFKAGINTQTYKYYIDFASKNHIEYVVLDEGWYNPGVGDMLTVIPEIDLPELIQYGKKKNVGIVLWCVFNVLDEQLEAACTKYSQMGAKGFKVDFLDRNDQTAVEMAYRIADKAAKYQLFLDYHGFYTPTGLNRTYPNLLNFEGVNGIEEFKWCSPEQDIPLYDVTFPYIRQMAGPVDYTPGAMKNAVKKEFSAVYSNPMSMGTRCHQLACYVIHDSPFTMLCDAPTNYEAEQECTDFIVQIPTEVDETKVLSGEIGKYIVTARRKGNDWYIAGYTNWNECDVELNLDFLPTNVSYKATLMKDGINADKQASDYKKVNFTADKSHKETLHLASGGGFALILKANN